MRKRPFIRSRLSKVIDFGTNGMRVYTSTATLVLSCTVSEIWRLKVRKSPILPSLPHLTPPLWGTPLNFGMKLAVEKLEGWGYCVVKIS